jgi:glycosyltransferase involved in cell wall biosynthesis
MELRISIVMPVFARQKSAEIAIRSAIGQTGPWIELIIVDDGSPEPFRLPEDLAGDDRIRVLRLEKNQGVSTARNVGVAAARGDWIAFLDSDDVWLPGKIERQADFVIADQAKHRDPLVLYCTGFRQVSLRSGEAINRIPVHTSDPSVFASGCWFSPGSTALLSKSAFTLVGGLDTVLRRLEDLDWCIRLGLAGGRLAVAPFIGAEVKVGSRPSFEAVDTACRHLLAKWSADARTRKLPIMRSLRAYLNVERAAACHSVGDYRGLVSYLVRSLLLFPRMNVHLRSWWVEHPVSATHERAELLSPS